MTAPLSPVEDAELIERVARAIYDDAYTECDDETDEVFTWDEATEARRYECRAFARAALQALPRYGEMKAECDAATKLATLFKALLDDANAEARELRGLLASIADDACSLGCPSYQPPGAPPLTHTERCIAVRAALNNGEEE